MIALRSGVVGSRLRPEGENVVLIRLDSYAVLSGDLGVVRGAGGSFKAERLGALVRFRSERGFGINEPRIDGGVLEAAVLDHGGVGILDLLHNEVINNGDTAVRCAGSGYIDIALGKIAAVEIDRVFSPIGGKAEINGSYLGSAAFIHNIYMETLGSALGRIRRDLRPEGKGVILIRLKSDTGLSGYLFVFV